MLLDYEGWDPLGITSRESPNWGPTLCVYDFLKRTPSLQLQFLCPEVRESSCCSLIFT